MTTLPVLALRPSVPVAFVHSEQGADVGQRYEIRFIPCGAYSAPRRLGWTDDPARASAVVDVWRRRSDTAAVWVYDRGTVGIFKGLQSHIEVGKGYDAALDHELYWWFIAQPEGCAGEADGRRRINFYAPQESGEEWFSFERYPLGFWSPTRSLSDARALTRRAFPGWWIHSGLCDLSGNASIGPDFDGPARERLLLEFPPERFEAGFDSDLRPGGDETCECRAILSCLLQARVATLQERRGHFSRFSGGENG